MHPLHLEVDILFVKLLRLVEAICWFDFLEMEKAWMEEVKKVDIGWVDILFV